MQIANILSDLNSLRVCDHSAALALVSARAPTSTSATSSPPSHQTPIPPTTSREQSSVTKEKLSWRDHDPDMQRATDLVELHYGVKVKHTQGVDKELSDARRDVERVMERLSGGRGEEER